jgi:hypothetical protein
VDFDARLQNRSFATVRTVVMTDHEGFDCCMTIAKVAWRVDLSGAARLTYRAVRVSHEWDGGVLLYCDDMQPEKPGTDLGLIGTAHPVAPKGSKSNAAFAWLQVGTIKKVVQIYGPRHFRSDGSVSPPGPLVPTPLTYAQCFGGRAEDGTFCDENPIGRGFDRVALEGKPAPSLEPVYDPLSTQPRAHAAHGCFGPIPDGWAPRVNRRGTRDEVWLRERYPLQPVDFDTHFYNWSAPGLHAPTPLRGDEPIEVGGVLAEGPWRFKLPLYPMRFEVDLDGQTLAPPTHLDGVMIDADTRVVELTYRAKTRLPLKWERLAAIRAIAEVPMDDRYLDPDVA